MERRLRQVNLQLTSCVDQFVFNDIAFVNVQYSTKNILLVMFFHSFFHSQFSRTDNFFLFDSIFQIELNIHREIFCGLSCDDLISSLRVCNGSRRVISFLWIFYFHVWWWWGRKCWCMESNRFPIKCPEDENGFCFIFYYLISISFWVFFFCNPVFITITILGTHEIEFQIDPKSKSRIPQIVRRDKSSLLEG